MSRDEWSLGKEVYIALLFSVLMITFMTYCFVVNNIQADVIEEELESLGASVISDVTIESPSIIFKIKEYTSFRLLFKEFGPIVFRVGNNFYLFDSDYQIAYKFTIIPLDAIIGIDTDR